MPSIQQIVAEIQLAPDLPPSHKAKAVQIIRDAEQRLKLKGVNSKPRKPSGKNLTNIKEWEVRNGFLENMVLSSKWVKDKNLSTPAVLIMVAEFRQEMVAKGKQYADFWACFQTYLTKGYLSKPLSACIQQELTHIDRKGVTL